MKSAVKKLVSIFLAVIIAVTMTSVGLTSVFADANSDGTYIPSPAVDTNTYLFAMPGIWMNDYWKENENCAGVYWFTANGTTGSELPLEWPGYKMKNVVEEGVNNLYSTPAPSDALQIIFNNHIDGGMFGRPDFNIKRFGDAGRTNDANAQYYTFMESDWYPKDLWKYVWDKAAEQVNETITWSDDDTRMTNEEATQIAAVYETLKDENITLDIPEFGAYAENFYVETENGDGIVQGFDNMVYVVNLNFDQRTSSTTIYPEGQSAYVGEWFFYYGNGEYGVWPTKELLAEKTGITFDEDGNYVFPVNDEYRVDRYGAVYKYYYNTEVDDSNNISRFVSKRHFLCGNFAKSGYTDLEIYNPFSPDSDSDIKDLDPPKAEIPKNNLSKNSVYFYANPSLWTRFRNISLYIYEHGGNGALTGWGSQKDNLEYVGNNFWGYDFDAHGITIEDGKQYGLIFTADWNVQSCDIIFDKSVMGDVAYLTGSLVENIVDSAKKSYNVAWRNADSTKYAPPVCFTSIGNVIGKAFWANTTAKKMMYDFLTMSDGIDTLAHVIKVNGKTTQQTIDDTAYALGLSISDISEMIETAKNNGKFIMWNENKSTAESNPGAVEIVRFLNEVIEEEEMTDTENIQELFDKYKVSKAEVKNAVALLIQDENNKQMIHEMLEGIEDKYPLLGDINNDGVVNSADRIYLSRYLANRSGFLDINEKAADVNADGSVDARDRIVLTRHIAKWNGYKTLPYAG